MDIRPKVNIEGVRLLFIIVGVWTCNAFNPCPAEFYFGPQCRFLNTMYYAEVMNKNGAKQSARDCVPNPTGKVTVDLPIMEHHITWIRVDVKDEESTSSLKITLMGAHGTRLPMLSERRSVSNTTVDVQFEVQGSIVEQVLVEGAFSSSCDIYISSGQNLPSFHEYSASMSSVAGIHKASLCVDGLHATSCATLEGQPNAWWKFDFPFAARIYSTCLVNNNMTDLAVGHNISIFDHTQKEIWSRHDETSKANSTYVYTVHHHSTAASYVIQHLQALEYYEIYIWGDYICKSSKFGPECQHDCNCADPIEQCFKNTGGCPGGCAVGFAGTDCFSKCPARTYGRECKMACSEHCAGKGECNNIDGKCEEGCRDGFQPPKCIEKESSLIMAILASALVILLLAVAALLLLRKPKSQPEDEDE